MYELHTCRVLDSGITILKRNASFGTIFAVQNTAVRCECSYYTSTDDWLHI